MDGLSKLKSPGVYCSLTLQAAAVYLIIQASQLQGQSAISRTQHLRQTTTPNSLFESERRSAQIQCSEGLAAYQWGAIGCMLLSIFCLSPHLFAKEQKDDESEGESEPQVKDPDMPRIQKSIPQVAASLQRSLFDLEQSVKAQPLQSSDSLFHLTVVENVRLLQKQNEHISLALVSGYEEIQKAATRLQRLMDQCRESANYSATNRVDWKKNKLIDIFGQMRQNLDNVADLAKNISSIHASTLRILSESAHGESILTEKIGKTQERIESVQSHAYSGQKIHDSIIAIISESRDNIGGAIKFANAIDQKWETLNSTTKSIDDVAKKIGSQSMAASLEMVRSSQGQSSGDLFPLGTELRSLSASFHTYARQLRDIIHDVSGEVSKLRQYLSQASEKSDLAFMAVNQCSDFYRGSIAAAKYSASELMLLQQEVSMQSRRLLEASTMGHQTSELMGRMERYVQGHHAFSKKVTDETGQIAIQSEKLSTLLSKQYQELNHCQKILASSGPLLTDSLRFSTESQQTVATLSACLDRVSTKKEDKDSLPPRKPHRATITEGEFIEIPYDDIKQIVSSYGENSDSKGRQWARK